LILAFVSIIRVLGFDSLLEAGGAIGIVGVFLALTQNAWAPDMFSGLIILNSGMVEVGAVIEFSEGEKTLGVVYKTKVFHTEILNLINNHRIMIKNSRLREQTVRQMFQQAFEIAVKKDNADIEVQYSIEIGDHAVEWSVYYYTKKVKTIMTTRQVFREEILKVSKQMNISLATPLHHVLN